MERDKKVKNGKLTVVLAHGIGQSFISREVNRDEVGAFLKDVLGA
jgi:3-dehydroquinate synthetase